jgi:23S rRNA pseudouridine1911/1915/1917 synthase
MEPRGVGRETLVVEEGEAGARLDAFLAARLGVSREAARRLLTRGGVRRADGARGALAKGARVGAGERLEVAVPTPERARRPAPSPDLALRALAEGPGWIAVDKPAGIAVHPLEEDEPGTLLGAVAARWPALLGVGEGGLRSGVLHRLDLETSGVVLFATDEATWTRLRAAFRVHRVRKRYRALVHGAPDPSGRARVALVVARHRPARVRVLRPESAAAEPRARETRLAWRVVERLRAPGLGEVSLVEVELETGFLHQIRATFAHLGHPVLGDRLYAPEPVARAAPRQLLHAAQIAVDEVAAASPDPVDFASVLAALREGRAPAW